MKNNLIAIAAIFGIMLSSAYGQVEKPVIPETEQECLAKGGSWQQIGLPGTPKRCDLKANDGGKICNDSSHCEGECMAPDDLPGGHESMGACSDYLLNFGCSRRIEKGRVGPVICAD